MQKQINPAAIKALALDLDGTTLLPDTSLGDRTAQCLRNLIAGGMQVILCTGRAIEASERYYSAVGASGPMVFFNGAEIADVPQGRILSSNLVDLDVVTFGIDLAREMGIHYQVYFPPGVDIGRGAGRREALAIDRPSPEADAYSRHTGITPVVTDLKKAIAAPGLSGCIKAMFITEPSLHDDIRRRFHERFGSRIYMARSSPTFFEIMNAGVSKGEGLTSVMRLRGLRPEAVIAFGDEENDVSMFSAAGFSAAPANAKDTVRAAADCIYGPCAEEGLAAYLEDLFLRK